MFLFIFIYYNLHDILTLMYKILFYQHFIKHYNTFLLYNFYKYL
jgi:hypothetical protein